MPYLVKEIYYTLQGEGAHTGRPAVFLRFTGCNLWSGREEDRSEATCQFCDTDFVGTDGENGGRFETPQALAEAVTALWPSPADHPKSTIKNHQYVVCTGGEPLLQLDEPAIAALQAAGFEVAVETNGTKPVPQSLDWVCVSPKAGAELVQTTGNELKLVYPQPLLMPESVAHLPFTHYYLQPMDGPDAAANTQAAIDYCLAHPQWRLSVQTHKSLGLA